MSDKPHRIAVLMGGPSAEREVSLRTGAACAGALREGGYEVSEVVVEDENFIVPAGTDLAFISLHGTFGEDGQVQDILKARGIPFTGADGDTSRITIDKEKTKEKFRAAGVPTPKGQLVRRIEEITVPLPVFIKPNSQGSSVGSRAAKTRAEVAAALADALKYDSAVLGRAVDRRPRIDRRRPRQPGVAGGRDSPARGLLRLHQQIHQGQNRVLLPGAPVGRAHGPGAAPRAGGASRGRQHGLLARRFPARRRRALLPRDQHDSRHDRDESSPEGRRGGGHHLSRIVPAHRGALMGGPAKRKERMNRRARPRPRPRPKQLNILHSTPAPKHSRKQIAQMAGWCALVLAMIVAVGTGLHFGIAFALDHVLYKNPRYALQEIVVEPRDRFSARLIRQAAGLELGMNLWALNLPQIARDLESIPNVASAKVERHFPDKISITLTERVPVVKIEGINIDLDTKETFYLDHDCVVLKPRPDEATPPLPQVVGLTDAELEPNTKLDRPILNHALEILDGINNSELRTLIDVTRINLGNPLSITMETHQGMTIIFRLDYIDQQLQRLQQIVDYADKQQRPLQTVDLTPDVNVPITFCQNQ